jgi:uncharacterized membrane protein (DUF2068 family)
MGSFRAMADRPVRSRPRLTPGFLAIIVFKYLKLAAFVMAGLMALRTARVSDHSLPARVSRFLEAHAERQSVQHLSAFLARADPSRIEAVGLASIAIGLVFGAEGTLLALRVWWATYFTIALTAIGVAIEVVEIGKRPGSLRLYVLLAVNLAILIYIWRRRNEFQGEPPRR